MRDRIVVSGLRGMGRHGVLPEERLAPQPFVADVVYEVDLAAAGLTDDLAESLSYATVAHEVVAILEGDPVDLVETLASRIAAAVLAHDAVEAVEVTVHKPAAPISVPFGDVEVRIRRERDVPFVMALGANLGDPARTLAWAVRELRASEGVRVTGVSRLYATAPVGGVEQPDFLNAAVVGRTRLAPRTLLSLARRLEHEQRRQREVRWGARTLDLDLIQYGDPDRGSEVVLDTETLQLPHPRVADRAFVLVPWRDADPGASLTVEGQVHTVASVLDRMRASGETDGVTAGPDWPMGVLP